MQLCLVKVGGDVGLGHTMPGESAAAHLHLKGLGQATGLAWMPWSIWLLVAASGRVGNRAAAEAASVDA